jgi:hypothetical protein
MVMRMVQWRQAAVVGIALLALASSVFTAAAQAGLAN